MRIFFCLLLSLCINNGDDMTDEQIKIVLDEIFFDFEENIFINNGVWPRKVNLVFAFSDYIEAMNDAEIAYYLNTNQQQVIDKFRLMARQGIEAWLKQNMKTLMI